MSERNHLWRSARRLLYNTHVAQFKRRVVLEPSKKNFSMDEIEALYLSTIEDIQEKSTRGDRYQIIRASGLLRHLLIDDTALIHKVNRKYRVKISFSVIDHDSIPILIDEPDGQLFIFWRNLDPSQINQDFDWITLDANRMEEIQADPSILEKSPYSRNLPISIKRWFNDKTLEVQGSLVTSNYYALLKARGIQVRDKQLKLSGFLSEHSLTFEEFDYSVLDIIKTCAHYKGGIHSGDPKEQKEQAILDLDKVMTVGDLDCTLANLKGIATVAVNGLAQLTQAVRSQV